MEVVVNADEVIFERVDDLRFKVIILNDGKEVFSNSWLLSVGDSVSFKSDRKAEIPLKLI